MSSSLIRGKYVVARVASPSEAVVVEDGAVFQRDGVIVEVGSYASLADRYQPDEVIGSADSVVLPGLVNSHHHVGLTPLQLGVADQSLELWIASRAAVRDVDPYLDTLYSAFELLESGVTTVHHLHSLRRGPWQGWRAHAERILQAYRDVGLRVNFSFLFRDQNRLVYGPDDEFVRSLPASIAGEVAEMLRGQAIPLEAYLAELFEGLWETWGRNTAPRTRIALAPHNLQWCSDEALLALKQHALRFGVGMHVHLLETPYQKEYARRRVGVSAVRHLYDLGFLGPDVTLGHGVWLTEADVELLAETDTLVCHNPSSNLRLKSGLAPLASLASSGVPVALGLDEAGINDDRDMLQEMRMALVLHRAPGFDAWAPSAAEVLRMATEHGARTTHYADEIGVLEPGRAADLAVLDWQRIAYPYLDPDVSVLGAVVGRARPGAVRTVLVGGEVVLRDGESTRLDRRQVLEELAARLRAPLRPDELRRREVAREVLPYVRRFYDGWFDPERADPFARYNARQ